MSIYRFQRKEQLINNMVLKPIMEAYELVKKERDIVNDIENTVTRKLVWHLKKNTSISKLCEKRTLSIVMRRLELITIDDVCEPDIQFRVHRSLWMDIEAKRIYSGNKWSLSEYLGKEGIDRFLTGYYSSNDNNAAMLGYVQNGNLNKIIKNAKTGISKKQCIKNSNVKGINNSFVSIHNRIINNDIAIYHLFLYFT